MGRWRRVLLAAGLLAACLRPAHAASQSVRGIVLEAGTNRAIDLAEVVLIGEGSDTVAVGLSDERGVFQVGAPSAGRYRVVARALGYVARGVGPFELEADGLRVVQVALQPAPMEIEGVEVETTRLVITDDALLTNGFYDRMMRGRGQFLTPEDIERSSARYTPQLFYELDHVMRTYRSAPWKRWVSLLSPIGRGACSPRVFVDGVWINKPRFELFGEGWGLTDVVPKHTIRAVELYWGLQAPLEYSAPAASDRGECGVILFWTKGG